MAYKSTLLSSLIAIRYDDTIDTLNDLENSGLPLLLPNNTSSRKMFASDPRKILKNIYKSSHIYAFNGTPPLYAWDM